MKNLTFLPKDAPKGSGSGYPTGATSTVDGVTFGFMNIMQGNQKAVDSSGKEIDTIALDVIQGKKLIGVIYNTTSFKTSTVKLTFLDKTGTYNKYIPVESVYGGSENHPSTGKGAEGTPVKSLVDASTDYKIVTQTFTFATPVDYVTIANDGDDSGITPASGQAVYFLSIEFNPAK